MNKSTSILKSAPFVLFIAMALAGCPGESPAEAYCNKVVQCDLGAKVLPIPSQTAAQCADSEDKAFAALHAQSACASTAEKLEDFYTCIGGQSCGDLAKLSTSVQPSPVEGTPQGDGALQVPQDMPCREEMQAMLNTLLNLDRTGLECMMLHTANLLPGLDFRGANGEAARTMSNALTCPRRANSASSPGAFWASA